MWRHQLVNWFDYILFGLPLGCEEASGREHATVSDGRPSPALPFSACPMSIRLARDGWDTFGPTWKREFGPEDNRRQPLAIPEQFRCTFRAVSEQFQGTERNSWEIALKLAIHLESFPSSGAVSEHIQSTFRALKGIIGELLWNLEFISKVIQVPEHFQSTFRALSEQFQGIERNNWQIALKLGIHRKSYPSSRALSEQF